MPSEQQIVWPSERTCSEVAQVNGVRHYTPSLTQICAPKLRNAVNYRPGPIHKLDAFIDGSLKQVVVIVSGRRHGSLSRSLGTGCRICSP